MSFEIPRENLIIIPVSFGVGLLLAGRHILGTAAIIIGAVAYLKCNHPVVAAFRYNFMSLDWRQYCRR